MTLPPPDGRYTRKDIVFSINGAKEKAKLHWNESEGYYWGFTDRSDIYVVYAATNEIVRTALKKHRRSVFRKNDWYWGRPLEEEALKFERGRKAEYLERSKRFDAAPKPERTSASTQTDRGEPTSSTSNGSISVRAKLEKTEPVTELEKPRTGDEADSETEPVTGTETGMEGTRLESKPKISRRKKESPESLPERPKSPFYMTAFISGHVNYDQNHVKSYYIPAMDRAIANGDHFVIGPAGGIDTIALKYLLDHGVDPRHITIHLCLIEATPARQDFYTGKRLNLHVEGVISWDRDASMTHHSDYDILKFRTPAEDMQAFGQVMYSSTQQNFDRRVKLVDETM